MGHSSMIVEQLNYNIFRGKDVMFTSFSDTLGDNIFFMPIYEVFQETYKCNIFLAIRPQFIEIFKDQYPNFSFIPFEEKDQVCVDLEFSPYYVDRKDVKYSEINCMRYYDGALKILYDGRLPRFNLSHPRIIEEPYVCIASKAAAYMKMWSYPDGWEEVISYLKKIGYRVLCVDKNKFEQFQFETIENNSRKNIQMACKMPNGAEDFTGDLPLQERIDLIKDADFFIGPSSGLSWMAWACNIPVVMISGFTAPFIEFETPYRVYPSSGCRGCHSRKYMCDNCYLCEHSKNHVPECSMNITPQMVIETINKIPLVQQRLNK